MLSFGILGCGRIGQVHARSLMRLESAKITALADAVPDFAEVLARRCNAETRSIEAIIEADDIDAVVICTPTDSHFDLIHSLAGAGKAIFCEKPVDLSSERVRLCRKAVEAAAVPFLIGFQRRFDPQFARLHKRLLSGEIGDVELVTILSRDPAPPPLSYIKRSGGIFRDMMIHDFDMARFVLREEPVRLFATGSCLVDPEIGEAGDVDSAAVTLTTASGKICQISNSRRASYGYDQRLEVHGSKGLLRVENLQESRIELADNRGFHQDRAQLFFLERYEAAYHREMEHFVEAVQSGQSPSPGMEDGLRAQALADAAAESRAQAKPVDITNE